MESRRWALCDLQHARRHHRPALYRPEAPSLSLAEPLVLPSVAAAVIAGTSIFGGRGGYTGTIIGALILTVLTTLLTILQMPEGARRILFGLIVLFVTAAYLRIVEKR
jgi:ribose transport system permease protein